MCELFGMSCNSKDRATRSLPLFSGYSGLNPHGWGIGYYKKNEAVIRKRAGKAR